MKFRMINSTLVRMIFVAPIALTFSSSCKNDKDRTAEFRIQHSKAENGSPLQEPRICSPSKLSSCSAKYNEEKQQITGEALKKTILSAAKGWQASQIKIVNQKAHGGGCDQRRAEATLVNGDKTLLLRLTDGIHTCECNASPSVPGPKATKRDRALGGGGIDSTYHRKGNTGTLEYNIRDCCSVTLIDKATAPQKAMDEPMMAEAAKVVDFNALRRLCKRL